MPKNESILISVAVDRFRENYFDERGETPATLSTWRGDYHAVFKGLPPRRVVSESLLREHILKTSPNTRSRRRFVLACALLADSVGIDHSLRRLIGNYSCLKVNPRDIPDDELISNTFHAIYNPQWQYVYGLMATYGLRNCECFLIDKRRFPIIEINSAKRGELRVVYPLYPEWVDSFGLADGVLPVCSGANNSDYGSRVSHAFKRYGVPFSPYSLRHAWARRSLQFGLDRSIAARMMGHSVAVHTNIYQRWLDLGVFDHAYHSVIDSPNRPVCPRPFTVKVGGHE